MYRSPIETSLRPSRWQAFLIASRKTLTAAFDCLETVRAITRSVPVAGRCFGHAAQIEIFHTNRSVFLGQSDTENPIPLSAPAIKLVR
jgi:hypothetical protein